MDKAFEYFHCLTEILPPEDVRVSGAWTGKPQRRYASPKQSATGDGPFVEVVDWRWDGIFEGASPLAGLAMLSVDQRTYWVKSQPPATRPAVSFSAHGWAAQPGSVSVTGTFLGAYLPSVPVKLTNEPPGACAIGDSATKTGATHVVARVEGVVFAVLILPASAIQVGRNRLWHLRENIASRLPSALHRLLTRGRSGSFDW